MLCGRLSEIDLGDGRGRRESYTSGREAEEEEACEFPWRGSRGWLADRWIAGDRSGVAGGKVTAQAYIRLPELRGRRRRVDESGKRWPTTRQPRRKAGYRAGLARLGSARAGSLW